MAESQIAAHFTFARRDIESLIPIDTDCDGSVTATELNAALPLLQILASDVIEIGVDNQCVVAQVTAITLALATFNVVQLPPDIVEPLIAVSIMYVGVENLSRRDLHRRWLLTFIFGLVHGLGFASVLRELGIGGGAGGGVVIPLLAFNLGVEIGQIMIALLVLPLIWKSQHFPNFFPRLATACPVLVALAGTYWLFERTLIKLG